MYQGGLLRTAGAVGGGGGGWLVLAKYLLLVPTELPSNDDQGSSVVVGLRWMVGTVTEPDVAVGSSGAGQFQKGDRPKSINKSPM